MDDLSSRGRTQRALLRKRILRPSISTIVVSDGADLTRTINVLDGGTERYFNAQFPWLGDVKFGTIRQPEVSQFLSDPLYKIELIPKDVQANLEQTKSGRKILLRFKEPGKWRRTSIFLDEVYKESTQGPYKRVTGTRKNSEVLSQRSSGVFPGVPLVASSSVKRFVLHFANNIRRVICPPKGGKSSISPGTAATVSGLATWIAAEFGVHLPAAIALATAVSLLLATGLKGAFCDMTAEELASALKRNKDVPNKKTWLDSRGVIHVSMSAKDLAARMKKPKQEPQF